jgi:hypothetical protein
MATRSNDTGRRRHFKVRPCMAGFFLRSTNVFGRSYGIGLFFPSVFPFTIRGGTCDVHRRSCIISIDILRGFAYSPYKH